MLFTGILCVAAMRKYGADSKGKGVVSRAGESDFNEKQRLLLERRSSWTGGHDSPGTSINPFFYSFTTSVI